MAGTHAGGLKCAEKNKRLYGEDFYRIQGRKGGRFSSPTKGFGGNRERARLAGQKGGRISRRGKAKISTDYVWTGEWTIGPKKPWWKFWRAE